MSKIVPEFFGVANFINVKQVVSMFDKRNDPLCYPWH